MNLDDARYALLSTRKRDASMVDTPVWFAGDASEYYVFSAGDAGKVKRIRNFRESTLAPCTVTGRPLGPAVDTSARLLTDPDDIDTAHRALIEKYGWQMRLLDWGAKLGGRYQRRAFIAITPSPSTAQAS